jgi:ketosteroid isomerase-like protein
VTDPRVELIREGFEASNRGDLDAVLASFAPDIEIRTETEAGPVGVYLGHEGYLKWVRSWMEVWEDFRWEVGEIEPHGDAFVIEVTSHGRAKASGIELSQPLTWLITIPEEQVTRIILYRHRDAALEALS